MDCQLTTDGCTNWSLLHANHTAPKLLVFVYSRCHIFVTVPLTLDSHICNITMATSSWHSTLLE